MRHLSLLIIFILILGWIGFPKYAQSAPELLVSSIPLRSQFSDNPHIRILVMKNIRKINVTVHSSFVLVAGNQTTQMPASNSNIAVAATENGFQFGSLAVNAGLIKIKTQDQHFEIDGKSFRDDLVLSKNSDGTFNAINDIGIEDYLKGVLPWEVSDEWPLETLKAQAVASRTFAVFKMLERAGQDHVLTSDVLAQVYIGKRIEKQKTNQAVDATRGQILMSGNSVFPGFFHSTCGGQTTRADFVWRIQPNSVLNGAVCSYCAGSKHDKWKASLSLKKIEQRIAARGFTISPIRNIQLSEIDLSGRAKKIVIEHSKGILTLDSNDFRVFVGPDIIRSTKATVHVREGMAYFSGFGWGHGVGLCQWGSKKLGELGKPYTEILTLYYPGSMLKNVYNLQNVPTKAHQANQDSEISLIEKMEQMVNDIFS